MKKFIGAVLGKTVIWFLLICFVVSVGSCTVKCVAGVFK